MASISQAYVFVNWNIAIRGPKANVIIQDASSPYIDRVDWKLHTMNTRHNYSVAPIVRCVDFHKVISGIGGAEIVLAMSHAMNTW